MLISLRDIQTMRKGIEFKIEDGKLFKAEVKPLERVNVGDCYYCGEPVWVAQGQQIKWIKRIAGFGTTEYPTHKKCRKGKKLFRSSLYKPENFEN